MRPYTSRRTEQEAPIRRTLLCGAGIAGPTLAYGLECFGHEPVLVERAPAAREGGYVIDFWGTGFEVAERMGLVPAPRSRRELWIRNQGLRLVSIPFLVNLFIGGSLHDPIEPPEG